MKVISITFIDERNVIAISQVPPKDYIDHCGLGIAKYKERISQHQNDNISLLTPIKEKDVCEDSDVFFKPTALVEKDGKVFGFRTPQKVGSLVEKVESMQINRNTESPRTPNAGRLPKTPQSPLCRTPSTPKTPTRGNRTPRSVKSLYRTPTNKGSARKSLSHQEKSNKVTTPSTPYSFRSKVKKRITEIVFDDDSDDSDMDGNYLPSDNASSSSGSGTEEEEMDINVNQTPGKKGIKSTPKLSRTPLRTPRRGREPKVDVDMTASSYQYFVHNSETNFCTTSDHTLSKLENPRLGPDVLKSLLEGAFKSHEIEREELSEDHQTLFPHWMTMMSEGFSIFLCGVGSKKRLLSLFQIQFLSDIDHVVINGFFPSLTLRAILGTIIEEIMELSSHPQGLNDQLNIIESQYNKESVDDPLFILVHNLEGPMLRNEKAQTLLSQLASFKHVHFIASVDHINAGLLFDGNKYSFYNPLWWDVTTLAPYKEETSYENSILVQQSGGLVLSSLIHVFKSLTPNAKGIFLILAKYQLSEKDNTNYAGLPFNELYQKCRECFLVNSDLTLRAQLTEFKDHKLIRTKKGVDGVENLIIPINADTLQEFLDQQGEEDL